MEQVAVVVVKDNVVDSLYLMNSNIDAEQKFRDEQGIIHEI